MTKDEIFMARAIALAQMAGSNVFPNPFVGAVIVLNNGVVAEGYHRQYGLEHAEVHAIRAAADHIKLNNCTIYVTLEPCAHYGKTPPCADLLVQHQFKRVVIGSVDPFALVNGAGIQRLKNAGIDVEVGVLQNECDKLNERFFTFHRQKRPFITLKWAESLDGSIAPNNQTLGERMKITGALSHQMVHIQRSQEHAILVGKNTALFDNPQLSVRLIDGKNPLRFVIDADLQLTQSLQIFQDGDPTYVLNLHRNEQVGAVHYVKLETIDVDSIGAALYALGILSVYVEGGKHTIQQFIDAERWDRIYRFIGKENIPNGISAPVLTPSAAQQIVGREHLEHDHLLVYER